MYDRGLKGSRS